MSNLIQEITDNSLQVDPKAEQPTTMPKREIIPVNLNETPNNNINNRELSVNISPICIVN